jgi:DNA segregation ATPase FtsK/SpoIIIE, S-DNA-T family
VLDIPGAERLLGRGDMLFMAPDASRLQRLQGTWVSDDEINRVVQYWKSKNPNKSANELEAWEVIPLNTLEDVKPIGTFPTEPIVRKPIVTQPSSYDQSPLLEEKKPLQSDEEQDLLYQDAVRVVKENGRASILLLQRALRINPEYAALLIDQLKSNGILGPQQEGTQGRELLVPAEPKPRIIGGEEDDAPKPRVWM